MVIFGPGRLAAGAERSEAKRGQIAAGGSGEIGRIRVLPEREKGQARLFLPLPLPFLCLNFCPLSLSLYFHCHSQPPSIYPPPFVRSFVRSFFPPSSLSIRICAPLKTLFVAHGRTTERSYALRSALFAHGAKAIAMRLHAIALGLIKLHTAKERER